MKENKWIFFVGIILGLLALSYESIPIPQSVADRISNQIVSDVSKKLNEKYGLKLGAIGGAQVQEKLKSITAYYSHYGKPLSIDTARVLMANIVEEYLQVINNNEELRPYLIKYPFTSANLSLAIFANTLDGKDYWHPNLDVIGNVNNKIEYITRKDRYTIVDKTIENYDETLEIVKKNHQLDVEK